MNETAIQSSALDYFITTGVAVDQLMRASLHKPDAELVLQEGKLTLLYPDGGVRVFGTRGIELTCFDWQEAAAAF